MSKYYYDEHAAKRAVAFIETHIRQIKGPKAGEFLILEEWQKNDIVMPLFGWKNKETNFRKHKTIYVEIPRKNGKSTLGAAIAIFCMFADEGFGDECFSVAGDRNQASIIFELATKMIQHSPELSKRAKVYRNSIVNPIKGNTYKVLSADAKLAMGHNAQFVAFDELHVQKDRHLFDAMVTSQAARIQPIFFMMTTAGDNKTDGNICYEQHQYCKRVLKKEIEDESFLGVIYAADENDDFSDPEVWKKANPNFGVSVTSEYFEQQSKKALDLVSMENSFKRLHLNIWTSSFSKWISDVKWLENYEDIDMKSLIGRPCFGGLDLASTQDMSSIVLYFPMDEGTKDVLLPICYVPRDAVFTKVMRNKVPYNQWERDGFLKVTQGDVQDYEFIRKDIHKLAEKYDIKSIAFDRWNSTSLVMNLVSDGLNLSPFGQGYASMSNPSKTFEKMCIGKELNHLNNPILRWQLQNVQIQTDAAENIKVHKGRSHDKVDAIVASIMAIGEFLTDEHEESVYSDRGLIVL